jgi:hypothetical protein
MEQETETDVGSFEIMMMDGDEINENDPVFDPIKFVVTRVTRTFQELLTTYWTDTPCTNPTCEQEAQHNHKIFDPRVKPKEEVVTIRVTLCQDFSCRHAPTLHSHEGVGYGEIENISLPPEVARHVYGTEHSIMHDIEPKNE